MFCQVERETESKRGICCENEFRMTKGFFFSSFFYILLSRHILCTVSSLTIVLRSQTACFFSITSSRMQTDRLALRHALVRFLNAPAALRMKREITWIWSEIVPACMVHFGASLLSDSVSSRLTFPLLEFAIQ